MRGVQPEVKDRELAIVPPILLQIPGLKALLLKSTDDMVQKLLDKYADVSAANPIGKVRGPLQILRMHVRGRPTAGRHGPGWSSVPCQLCSVL